MSASALRLKVSPSSSELPVAGGEAGVGPRCRQRQHPLHIGCRHEVQRPAHRPGPHDRAVSDRLLDIGVSGVGQAQADRPLAGGVVLRLHRPEVRDDFGRRGEALLGDLLVSQAEAGDVEGGHRCHIIRSS